MKRCFKIILILFAVLCILLLTAALLRNIFRQLYPLEYTRIVTQAAQEFSLEPALVYAVINCESGFDQSAVSDADAMGLMQITRDTFHWAQSRMGGEPLDTERLFDPETNIRFGCFILSMHLREFGSTELALAAYHAGRGSVNKWLADETLAENGALHTIPFQDTAAYVKRVTRTVSVYKTLYGDALESAGQEHR